MLKEHRKFKILKDAQVSVADFRTQQKVLQLKADLRQKITPNLIKKNAALKSKVSQLEEELSTVNWYIEVMEHGVDTKHIAKEYSLLKKEHKVLKVV